MGLILALCGIGSCQSEQGQTLSKTVVLTPSLSGLPDGVGKDDLVAQLRAAAARWSYPAIPCTFLRVRVENPRPLRIAQEDAVNLVVFRSVAWCHNERCGHGSTFPLAAAAMTTTYPRGATGRRVVEGDIELNAVTFAWGGANDREKVIAPLAAVLTHEIGHVLGFSDTCKDGTCTPAESSSVMRSGNPVAVLNAWDVRRVCDAFPR